jgi:hypothetical protein
VIFGEKIFLMFFVPAAGRFRAGWWIFPMVSVIVKAAVHESFIS